MNARDDRPKVIGLNRGGSKELENGKYIDHRRRTDQSTIPETRDRGSRPKGRRHGGCGRRSGTGGRHLDVSFPTKTYFFGWVSGPNVQQAI